MKIWYDTEFLENGSTIELISIGLVAEDGREYYGINRDAPWYMISQNRWLMDNVIPYLPDNERMPTRGNPCSIDFAHRRVRDKEQIAIDVENFLAGIPDVELWAYYGAYDHVVLAQLWGRMIELPKHVPMFTHELMQFWEEAGQPELPEQISEHDALADARWNQDVYHMCRAAKNQAAKRDARESGRDDH